MRIYELAKELGVENKIVIAKANELGMYGKASHSHALDPDEADKLRRAIARQANNAQQKNAKTETITRRVDKVTGTAEAIVESRSGNVIRRRRASPSDNVVAQESPPVNPSEQDSVQVARSEQHGDDLFTPPTSEVETPAEETVANAAPIVAQESAATAESAEVELAPAEVVEEAAIAQEPVVSPPPVRSGNSGRSELREQKNGVRVSTGGTSRAPVTPQAAPPEAAVDAPKKAGIGPKVLGKIELVQKKPMKVESKRGFGSTGAPLTAKKESEEDDEFKKGAAKRRTKKREINRSDLIDYEGSAPRRLRPGSKPRRDNDGNKGAADQTKMKASKRVVKMDDTITVGELAKQMSLKAGEVIAKLMELGMMATINQALDFDTATIVATEFEYAVESVSFKETEITKSTVKEEEGEKRVRPPVVTIMGHVDHGKTSLLDAIRNASVAAKEHGGITQHIGAYQVVTASGKAITFLDTPGHAAFTSMRARGAQVTDIVVLVVAADEGPMPQTLEALSHAQAAKVAIIVAVNKMDKPGANPDKVKQQLAERGLNPEEWGGDTMYIPVSAHTKAGIPDLLESILLVADVRELKASYERRAQGAVVEARQEKGRGAVATVLVQNGTLRVGDTFVAGADYGRVRSMLNDKGEKVEIADPSFPVEITGFASVPEAGDDFVVVESEAQARQIAQNRAEKKQAKEQRSLASGPISLEEFARRANNMAIQDLNVILKADVHGSVEAVKDSLEKLSTEKVRVKVLHAAVGGVTESDVQLAMASDAVIVGFGVRAETRAEQLAEVHGIDMRFYRIIYEVIDDVKKAMTGLLAPLKKEVSIGRAEVRNTFTIPKIGTIAGCFVVSGLVRRNAKVRLLRDSRVIYEASMGSLRRFKDDAREVQSGYECGIGIEGYNDVKVGDVLDVFEIQETPQEL